MLEPWLRGPIPNMLPLLQPAAHALIQAEEDVHRIMQNFDPEFLWIKPVGRASVGFHLQHISGVIDRMMTYAANGQLTEKQLDFLSDEGQPFKDIEQRHLLKDLDTQIGLALEVLKNTPENNLTETRFVGRKKLPSTLIGILFHTAEHVQRHVGQLLVTVSVVSNHEK